jgi:DNA-directed RNA polymerase specialized sigma24 family protein
VSRRAGGSAGRTLDGESFERLLHFLDADRERAGEKYERIRRRLIWIFTNRGSWLAEDLADETINRVCARIDDLSDRYSGDPALYFYGVARKVHLESLRHTPQPLPVTLPAQEENLEPVYDCLDRCLDGLPPQNRFLVVEYYREEKQAKIDRRRELAAELGIPPNALRIRAHRIRTALNECIQNCLDRRAHG